MTESQQELLHKAQRSIEAAQSLLRDSYPEFAVSRAYYTMFYIASAILEGENMTCSKHSAVISAFGRYFVQPKRVFVESHRWLIEAQELRLMGDYGESGEITQEQAEQQIERAQKFIELGQEFITNNLEI